MEEKDVVSRQFHTCKYTSTKMSQIPKLRSNMDVQDILCYHRSRYKEFNLTYTVIILY